jgi:hypothetical protein
LKGNRLSAANRSATTRAVWRRTGEKNMFRTKKRIIIAVGVAIVALIAAIAGYAYWSTTGAGTASGDAGTTQALVLHGSFPAGIYPGGTEPVTFTVDNPNPGNAQLGTIHLVSVTPDAGHSSCLGTDFGMADVAVNAEITPGTGRTVTPTGTLTYTDTAVSQDACKSATLTLNLTSS